MEYHCPECKKAVWHTRIQFVPFALWLLYIAFAPKPYPPYALEIGVVLVLVWSFGWEFYFKRHR